MRLNSSERTSSSSPDSSIKFYINALAHRYLFISENMKKKKIHLHRSVSISTFVLIEYECKLYTSLSAKVRTRDTYDIRDSTTCVHNPAILMLPVVLTRCSFYFLTILYAVDSVNLICLLELLACSFYS